MDVVIYEVITDTNGKNTLIIGAYLQPSTLKHLTDLEEALIRFRDHNPIVLGDLSADIGQAQNPRSQQVAGLLMEFRMMDLLLCLRQRWRHRKMKTWTWVRQGILMQARSDYILGKDRRRSEMVEIRGVRDYP